MKITINIKLKNGILDPQGKAVEHALSSLGYKNIDNVRIGKQIVLDIKENDKNKAKDIIEKVCQDLLANPVIEEYEIVL